ncbi:MAG: alpha/beta hydrolase [Pseudomonadota bacterium]
MGLSRLAAYVDTWDGARKAAAFKAGWPAKTRDDIAFFDTGKVQFRYRLRGQGPTIVFTADPPVTLELYDEMIAHFSAHFRVVIFELPAMGFSAARASYGFGFRETNDEVAKFLEAVAGPQAILAFSCVAGLAAVDIAARYPQLVSAMTLLQVTDWEGYKVWKAGRDPKKILGKPFIGQVAMKRLAASRAPMWYDLVVGVREKITPFCDCAAEAHAHGSGWKLASAYQRYLFDGASPLATPDQKTLVIWGKEDGSHGRQSIERARHLARAAEVVELDDIGHFPELEDTKKACEVITGFLAT